MLLREWLGEIPKRSVTVPKVVMVPASGSHSKTAIFAAASAA